MDTRMITSAAVRSLGVAVCVALLACGTGCTKTRHPTVALLYDAVLPGLPTDGSPVTGAYDLTQRINALSFVGVARSVIGSKSTVPASQCAKLSSARLSINLMQLIGADCFLNTMSTPKTAESDPMASIGKEATAKVSISNHQIFTVTIDRLTLKAKQGSFAGFSSVTMAIMDGKNPIVIGSGAPNPADGAYIVMTPSNPPNLANKVVTSWGTSTGPEARVTVSGNSPTGQLSFDVTADLTVVFAETDS
jgi:hypothetical protein